MLRFVRAFVIRERFFRWEEGRRQSFFVESASLPNYRRLGDDLQLTPLSPSSCRLVWTIAAEPRPWARRPKSPTALITRKLFADTGAHFDVR